MTTRTFAANATALPGDHPDRRRLLAAAGAAAVLAAIGGPAEAASDPDATLLALRPLWLAARGSFDAEKIPRTPGYAAALAALPPVPKWYRGDREGMSIAIRSRCAALEEIEKAYPQQVMSAEAEERQEAALDAESAIIDEIVTMPARTLAGLGFKAEVSLVNDHMEPALVASIIADLAALAAAQATVRM